MFGEVIEPVVVNVDDEIANCDAVDLRHARSGRILNSSEGQVVLTPWECQTANGTFVECGDVSSAITIPAGESSAIPAELMSSHWVKFVEAAGAGVVTVVLKP